MNSGEIEGGFQVNGASGAENSFTVDGVVTNSLINGSSRQNTVFEYLQEVQVKTGGIDAEYGGALGGVISAVTKSGGNTFTGEGHYYFVGSALGAGPVKRLVLDPVDDNTVGYFQDDKQVEQSERVRRIDRRPDRQEPAVLLRLVLAARRPSHEQLPVLQRHRAGAIDQEQTARQAFGKVTYAAGRVHANASLLMTPTRSTGTLPAYDAHRHELPDDIERRERGESHARLRGRSEQRQRQRRL